MTEYSDPARRDKVNNLPEGSISQHIDLVRTALGETKMSGPLRAQVLADHFVGSTLRTFGAVEGYRRVINPIDTTPRAKLVVTDPETGEAYDWFRVITRDGGARRAVVDISDGPMGWQAVNNISNAFRIETDANGESIPESIMMASMDQITAYLETETEQSEALNQIERASMWQRVLLDEITTFLDEPYRNGAWNTPDNMGSEVAGVRHSQIDWERAAAVARKAGVDIDLLVRSAEFMKKTASSGQSIGKVALVNIDSWVNRSIERLMAER